MKHRLLLLACLVSLALIASASAPSFAATTPTGSNGPRAIQPAANTPIPAQAPEPSSATSNPSWLQQPQPPISASPPARDSAAMAYDGATGHVLLFGGWNGQTAPGVLPFGDGALNDTWTWDGSTWKQLLSPGCINTCPSSPPARYDAAMTYDAATQTVLLFGGSDNGGDQLGDTWSFNGSAWTQLSPANSPPARDRASMVYDPATHTVLLFGGNGCSAIYCGDTWTWDGSTWTQLHPATSPPARIWATMAHNGATGRVVLFGGIGFAGDLNDTWSWDGSTWTQLQPAGSPPARHQASMAYDAASDTIVLFGGQGACGNPCNDTWTWDGTTWAQASTTVHPTGTYFDGIYSAGMAYDAVAGTVALFGGIDGSVDLEGIWSWNGTTWRQLNHLTSAPGRVLASSAYDQAHGQVVLFGGQDSNSNPLADTWVWDGSNWTQRASGGPSPRTGAAMAYDDATKTVILFGGCCYTDSNYIQHYLNDTWSWNGSTWTQVNDGGSPGCTYNCPNSPAPRFGASMAYDPPLGSMVLFGGDNDTQACSYIQCNDTWTWNGSAWVIFLNDNTPGSPPARDGATMAYNAATQQLILFGGHEITYTYQVIALKITDSVGSDAWAFSYNGIPVESWSPLPSGPTSRMAASMGYDAASGSVVLFGGLNYSTVTTTDQIEGGFNPIGYFDPVNYVVGIINEIVDLANSSGNSPLTVLGDTWAWNGQNWSQLCSNCPPLPRGFGTGSYDAATSSFVLFGGATTSAVVNDTWTLGGSQPVITGISPNSGYWGSPSTVLIGGSNLNVGGTPTVHFGPATATNVSCSSSTLCTATDPGGSSSGASPGTTVDVTVTTSQGTSATTSADRFSYLGFPSATGISPSGGPMTGRTAVTISGTNFDTSGGTSVQFGGAFATNVNCPSTTRCTAYSPPGAAGSVGVRVTTSAGTSASVGAPQFTYGATPVVTGISPRSGPSSGGTTVTITGSNVQPASGAVSVSFGGVAAGNVSCSSNTTCTATSPAGGGSVPVTVTSVGVSSAATPASLFTFTSQSSASWAQATGSGPSARSQPSLAFDVAHGQALLFGGESQNDGGYLNDTWTWTGSAWTQQHPAVSPPARASGSMVYDAAHGNVVLFGGYGCNNSYCSDTWLWNGSSWTQQSPAYSPPASLGAMTYDSFTHQVILVDGPNVYTWNGSNWSVTSPPSSPPNRSNPALSYDPATGTVLLFGGCCFNANGSSFYYDDTWSWDGNTWTQLSPATSPPARGNASLAYNANTGKMVLFGGCCSTNGFLSDTWTWDGNTWMQQSPASSPGARENAGFISIDQDGSTVLFGGDNFGGSGFTPYGDTWVWGASAAAPAVTSLSPAEGPAAGGTVVTIGGANFATDGSATVKFGATAASKVSCSSSQCTATSPAGSGSVHVSVSSGGLQSSPVSADVFTYLSPPTIVQVSPAEIPGGVATPLTIVGTNFDTNPGATTIKVGALAASDVSCPYNNLCYATSPAASTGGAVDVTATTAGGASATGSADQITILTQPSVTGVTPNSGPLSGGGTVTITGTGFDTAPSSVAVSFIGGSGGIVASGVSCSSATQCTATVPAAYPQQAQTVDVVVATLGGQSLPSSADQFTYVAAPSVSEIAPKDGPPTGGTMVTITGDDLSTTFGPTMVKFGANPASNVSCSSTTQCVATSPAGTTGTTVDVTVTNLGDTSASVTADQFTYTNAPIVTGLSPADGPTIGDTTVTITGKNFDTTAGNTTAKFGSSAATSVSCSSTTQCSATSPSGSGTVDVTVTTGQGTSITSGADLFTYVALTSANATWTQQTASAPPARGGASVAYDSANNTVVLFGGSGDCGHPCTDTWAWNGAAWSNVTPATSPTGDGCVSMAYDAATSSILLFDGAYSTDGIPLSYVTTWSWNGSAWAQLSPANSPPPRCNASMAYDAATNNVVLFGGLDFGGFSGGGFLGDTWTWNGSNWTQQQPVSSPPARDGAGLAYDPATGNAVLFSGYRGTTLNDTWSWDGTTWTQLSSATSPPARVSAGLAYNPATSTLLLFGGQDNNYNALGDTWSWDGANWTPLNPGGGPAARQGTAMAGDAATGTVLLFGGYNNGYPGWVGDTWTWGLTPQVVSGISPSAGLAAGGTSVTIAGSGFTGATAVQFGSTAAQSFTVNSNSQIMAVSPAGSGTVDVQVRVAGQWSVPTAADRFSFLGTPTVTAVSPASGPTSGGTAVTISGTNFDTASSGTTIKFGANPATNVNCISPTNCTAASPTGSGTVDVLATTPAGTSAATSADQFSYSAAPAVSSISPTSGPTAGGTTVTISGANFASGATVKFGTTAATGVGCGTTSCTVTSPAGSGSVDVTVTTASGTSATNPPDLFTYVSLAPAAAYWTQEQPSTSPQARLYAGMTYDSVHGNVLLFGGEYGGSNLLGDTWTWNGSTWSQQNPSTSPPSRYFGALAYDAAHQQAVLFGGISASNSYLDDTWTWDGTTWTQQHPAFSPPAQFGRSMVYDAATATVVLVDPVDGSTWTWDGVTWTQQHPVTSPPARGDAAIAYDPATAQVVLFGGYGCTDSACSTGNVYLGDTWTWNGSNWTKQQPASSPSARLDASMAFDASTGTAVLFGGISDTGSLLNETWSWDGSAWTQLSPATIPPARYGASMAFDAANSTAVLFGGSGSEGALADTWILSQQPPAVTGLSPAAGPTSGGTSVTISGSGFSGATAVAFGTTAATSFTVNSDSQITATSPAGAASTVDVRVTTLIATSTIISADRFTYLGAPTVTGVSPTSGPTSGGLIVSISGISFDPTPGHTTIKFGATAATGVSCSNSTSCQATNPAGSGTVDVTVTTPLGTSAVTSADQFTYLTVCTTCNQTWAQQQPTTSPSQQNGAAMAYDAANGTLVLFDTSGNTWTWSGGAWTQQSPATSPPGRQYAGMAYDAALGKIVLFGGVFYDDTWTWDGTTWTPICGTSISGATASCGPPGRSGPGMAYDAAHSVVVIFGGDVYNDTWTWSGSNWTQKVSSGCGQSPACPNSPPGRRYPSMIYDTAANSVLLFGGTDGNGNLLNDTWTWNGSAWTQQNPASSPPGRTQASMAYDTATATAVLFGGSSSLCGDCNDTWTWNGSTWAQVDDSGAPGCSNTCPASPPGRYEASMAYAANRGVLVLFGGCCDRFANSYNDTWIWGGYVPTVSSISPISGPAGGGTAVSISGTNFDTGGSTTVQFSGNAASNVSCSSATSCTTTSPAGSGTVDVTVTTAGGTSVTSAADKFTYTAPSAVSGISPNSGADAGGAAVTISGSGFDTTAGATTVRFGANAAADVLCFSTTICSATSPAGTGAVDVTVTTPGGTSATSSADQFTYIPLPVVTGVSPNSGPSSGGTVVTITGSNFSTALNGTSVQFGSAAASNVSCTSANQCTATSPAGSGTVAVTVITSVGASPSNSGDLFTYSGVRSASWTELSPAANPTNPYQSNSMTYDAATGTVVFFSTDGTTWTWDGSNWMQQHPSTSPPGRIYASLSYDAATGKVVLFGGLDNNVGYMNDTWTWDGSNWTQQISPGCSVNFNPCPNSPPVRDQGSMAYDAASGYVLLFGGFDYSELGVTTVYNDTWAWNGTAWIQLGPGASPSTRYGAAMTYNAASGTILLFGGENASSQFLGDTWIWDGNTWSQQSPSSSPPARYDAGMAYDGATGTVLLFGGASGNNNSNDTWGWNGTTWTQLVSPGCTIGCPNSPPGTAGIPLAFDPVHGTVVYTVEDPSANFAVRTWVWGPVVPVVSGISPALGPATGGTNLTISGSHFTGATAVQFGSVAATSFAVNSDSQVSATAPAGSGLVDVTVTANGLSSAAVAADQFTYLGLSSISAVSPNQGTSLGGTSITISGSGFVTGATTFKFGANAAASASCTSSTQCTATSPAGSGSVDVTATTPGGASATGGADHFTYLALPTVTGVSPNSGPPSGGTTVTITGTNLDLGTPAVQFGNVAASVTCSSSSQCTATSPAGNGSVDVTVTTSQGTSATGPADRFTYVTLAPSEITWSQLQPATSPTARSLTSMAYDAATNTVVLFGGCTANSNCGSTGLLGDTWTWDGSTWTQLSPATSPPAREDAAMAYDAANGTIVLFGGSGSGFTSLGDTWSWDGSTWTQLSPATSPSARYGASMTYGPATGTLVLFGGVNSSGLFFNDTWSWNGSAWTHLSSPSNCSATCTASPGVRYDFGMDYDAGTGTIILFGGQGCASYYCGDTWSWNGSAWTQLSPAQSPSPRFEPSMKFDAATGKLLLFGGRQDVSSTFTVVGDTWTFDGTTWTQLSPAASPGASEANGMAYDTSGRLILFGGSSGNATWTWGAPPPSVSGLSPSSGPATGGTIVTLTGSTFATDGSTTIRFGASPATNVSCSSTTQCTATSPRGVGTVAVTVATLGGASSANNAAKFAYPALGDVNGDGQVSAVDALCVLRQVAGLPSTTACPLPPPGDAIIATNEVQAGATQPTAVDALCILRGVAELPATSTCPLITASSAASASVATNSRSPEQASSASPSPSVQLTFDPATAQLTPGQDTSVNVSAKIITGSIGAWTVDVHYDPTLVKLTDCKAASGSVCNVNLAKDTLRVVGASAAGLTGSDVLATLTLAAAGESTGATTLHVQTSDLTNARGAPVVATATDGQVDLGAGSPVRPAATPSLASTTPTPAATPAVRSATPTPAPH